MLVINSNARNNNFVNINNVVKDINIYIYKIFFIDYID